VANKTKNYPVWSSHTVLPVNGKTAKWGHVFALHLASPFSVAPSHLPLDVDAGPMLQWTGWGATSNITLGAAFDASHPIALPACAAHDFQLHHTAPIFSVGARKLALLGEPVKWVPVAERRVTAVTVSAAGMHVTLSGDPDEVVDLAFAEVSAAGSASVLAVSCTLSATGSATAAVAATGSPKCA
jgi:hypothetical protein